MSSPDYAVDQEVGVYDREGCQDLGNRPRELAEESDLDELVEEPRDRL
jgi:hypothetical protein